MKYSGIELIKHLSLAFGPTGREDVVRELIIEQIEGDCDGYCEDRVGNLIAKVCGRGLDYHPEKPQRLMLSAHMDEVGFMIRQITDEGYLKFGTLGGIDPRVLCGRGVTIYGKDDEVIHGVIASKAIHMQTAEERTKITPADKLYIDIGALDKADAETKVSIGDCATFTSDFVTFGEGEKFMKGKALDDRCGCAVLIETMRYLHEGAFDLPFDVYFAFTRCEEIGISGATAAAHRFRPDYAIVLETTAIADLPDVPKNSRVSEVGNGGVVSLMDRSTIYNRDFVDGAMKIAEENGIPAQIKRYVSGGNDAGHIHKTADGTRCLAISAPTRYLHSASCVIAIRDFESIKSHVYAILTSYEFS